MKEAISLTGRFFYWFNHRVRCNAPNNVCIIHVLQTVIQSRQSMVPALLVVGWRACTHQMWFPLHQSHAADSIGG